MRNAPALLPGVATVAATMIIATLVTGACLRDRRSISDPRSAATHAPTKPLRGGFQAWHLASGAGEAVLIAPGSPVRTLFIRNDGPATVQVLWQRNGDPPRTCLLAPGASSGSRGTQVTMRLAPGGMGRSTGIFRIETEHP